MTIAGSNDKGFFLRSKALTQIYYRSDIVPLKWRINLFIHPQRHPRGEANHGINTYRHPSRLLCLVHSLLREFVSSLFYMLYIAMMYVWLDIPWMIFGLESTKDSLVHRPRVWRPHPAAPCLSRAQHDVSRTIRTKNMNVSKTDSWLEEQLNETDSTLQLTCSI